MIYEWIEVIVWGGKDKMPWQYRRRKTVIDDDNFIAETEIHELLDEKLRMEAQEDLIHDRTI